MKRYLAIVLLTILSQNVNAKELWEDVPKSVLADAWTKCVKEHPTNEEYRRAKCLQNEVRVYQWETQKRAVDTTPTAPSG